MIGVEAITVSSKDITGFDKLSKEMLKFSVLEYQKQDCE